LVAVALQPDIYVPDGASLDEALRRATHVGIGAHQDDLEFMAYSAIAECHASGEPRFFGLILTDGTGSIRDGASSAMSAEEFALLRRQEQREAAAIGRYSGVVQFPFSSKSLRETPDQAVRALIEILERCRATKFFLHSPFDKHATHRAVCRASLQALQTTRKDGPLETVVGCEVWRSLDWIPDHLKIVLDCSYQPALANQLHTVFASQIGPGKRYDRATVGRWHANATFYQPRSADGAAAVSYGVDLRELVVGGPITLEKYVDRFLTAFCQEIRAEH
jgi:LmbE family N-acetylglucosaminyl deacetylase